MVLIQRKTSDKKINKNLTKNNHKIEILKSFLKNTTKLKNKIFWQMSNILRATKSNTLTT